MANHKENKSASQGKTELLDGYLDRHKAKNLLLSGTIILLTALGWYFVRQQNQSLTQTTISTYQQTELEIVRSVARSIQSYVTLQMDELGRTDIAAIEQEIFKQFVEPVRLLENGDAWIYTPDYIVYDQSADLPAEYHGKSMAEIFALQTEQGANHYEAMVEAVMQAQEGVGWYIWLPEKGQEIAAWTPVTVGDYVWIIGLSTPLPEILEANGDASQIRSSVIIMSLGTVVALALLVVWVRGVLKQAQVSKALAESNLLYESLVNTLPRRVYRKDKQNKFVFGNQAFLTELGQPLDNLVGKTEFDFYPTELAARRQQDDQEVLQSGMTQDAIEEYQLPGDQKRYMQVTRSPVHNSRGEVIGLQGISWDITHRRHAELERERLLEAEREQRLRAETLGQVFLALTAQISYEAVLDEILRQVRQLVSCSATNIVLLQDDILKIERWQGYETFDTGMVIANLEQPLADFPIDAYVVRSRQSLVIPNVQQDPHWITTPIAPWIKSFMAAPICLQDRVLGILRLDSNIPYNFSARDINSLQPLANAAAIALENARLYEQAQQEIVVRKQTELELIQRNTELMSLLYAGATVSTSLDIQIVLDTITHEMISLLGVGKCILFQWDESENKIFALAEFGVDEPRRTETTRKIYDPEEIPLARQVLADRYAQQITLNQPEIRSADWTYMHSHQIKTLLMLPMEFQNRIIGLIQVMDGEIERVFTYVEIGLAQLLTNQATSALENAKLYNLAQRELAERIKIEEELRWVAARNQAILDAIPDALLVLDHDGRILDYKTNDDLSSAIPFRGDESSNEPRLPSDWTRLILYYIDRLLRTGQMQTFECQYVLAKEIQDFEVRLVISSRDEILTIIRNITSRKQAERSLQESEAKFRSLTETTAAAIFIYQGDRNCYVNPTAKLLTGYTEAELLAMNFWDIIHPDFRTLVKERGMARQRQETIPSRYEIKILTKNREERWIDVTLGLIKFEGSVAVLGTAFDISERKWATEALRKSEANLKAIFDNSMQAFILMDLNYTVQALNRTTIEGIKLTLGKEISVGSSAYDFVLAEDRDEVEQCFARAKSGESISLEKCLNIEGVERWFEYHYNPVFSDEGQVVGICLSTVDINERKIAADTLAASEARLLAEMQSVLSITRALVSETHPDNLLNFIITQAKQLMKTDGAVVLLLNENDQYLELTPIDETQSPLHPSLQLPLQGSLAELAITSGTVQSGNQSSNDNYIISIRKLLAPAQIHSLWCAPLGVQGQTLGVLLLWTEKERNFTDRDNYLAHLFADEAALALYNARLHIENRKLAVEQERQRLARELHDSVTQSLYSIGMAAQASLRLMDKGQESKLEDPVKYIHQLSQVALAEMRERVYGLHPTVLKERDLTQALQGYCEMLSEQYGLTVDFAAEDNLKFSLYQRENLYYIAREALWNIVKHAGPTHVTVRLNKESKGFILTIVDQGPGFALPDSQRTEMMGLRSMEERAKLLMGSFEIHSEPGTGTQITIQIPTQLPQMN